MARAARHYRPHPAAAPDAAAPAAAAPAAIAAAAAGTGSAALRAESPAGRLLVVATPIGNLGDLSPRAREAFAAADVVACEDTRRTGRLLAHLGLRKPLVSLHDHNERLRLPRLLGELGAGRVVALASDAGTPLLSDPGYLLVREAAARGARIEPLPGPSGVLAALVASALPPYPFTFAGFAPPRQGKRRGFYRGWAALGHTLVVYEAPHRLLASLEDALTELGDRPAAVARELTKLHEEVVRAPLAAQLLIWRARPTLKGEIVLVIGAARKTAPPNEAEEPPAVAAQETPR
jgi:16S rRNA (cytidine1402-2'-O)-methyltransferase